MKCYPKLTVVNCELQVKYSVHYGDLDVLQPLCIVSCTLNVLFHVLTHVLFHVFIMFSSRSSFDFQGVQNFNLRAFSVFTASFAQCCST